MQMSKLETWAPSLTKTLDQLTNILLYSREYQEETRTVQEDLGGFIDASPGPKCDGWYTTAVLF